MRGRLPRGLLGLGAAAVTVLLAGCVGETGALVGPAAVPAEAPRTTGVESAADRDHAKLVAAFGGEYRAPDAKRLLDEIAARLAPATDRPDEQYRITILDTPVVNAFALPNGRLYVSRGLLALADDTAEVAAVLAHEIAHVTLRHANARSELEARSALVSRVVSDVLKDPSASAMVLDRSRVSIASFSRNQEFEADQIGVKTLSRAGYDPYGAARFLTALERAGGGKSRGQPDMLSTHPATQERIAVATQAARRIGAPGLGEHDRDRYLSAIDGIAFGDNPADGVVRGRRFVHARLGVGFEAPEGLSLENTASAVLGSSADGNRRLLFDAVEPTNGQGLEDVLLSSWSDAIETGSVESTTINGHPTALATSRGKEWAFRMAAVRVGSSVYRLIYATHALTPEMERAFRSALESVHQVTAEEARSLRPLQIRIVRAAEGETVESLAGRMAVTDKPLERFLVLNGLDRGSALAPGRRYKIVVE